MPLRQENTFEMAGFEPLATVEISDSGPSHQSHPRSSSPSGTPGRARLQITGLCQTKSRGLARRTSGVVLLLVTVFLWTASNFLASTIFADNSFSKPYFVTYVNTSFFSVIIPAIFLKRLWSSRGSFNEAFRLLDCKKRYIPVDSDDNQAVLKPDGDGSVHDDSSPDAPGGSEQALLPAESGLTPTTPDDDTLDLWETGKLSLEFCILWFAANYFVAACLEYTTVASSTILTSTSSIFTLLFGSLIAVEQFTLKKLIGVLASLAGVVLISSVDISGVSDENRGSFPHKSPKQIAIGDALALASAVLYGFYTVMMKKRIRTEERVSMPLFFGFVGAFNIILLWPGFFILHFTRVESFEIPPTKRIWAIVLINSATSLVSDFCWAYAMLLTSPLVVTVGISLSIPLSLIGQMIINSQTSSFVYWLGAGVVLLSFIFINHATKEDAMENTRHAVNDGNP